MSLIKKFQNTWISEYLIEESLGFFSKEVQTEARSFIEEGLVHEVYVEPGRLSSRVSVDKRMSVRIVLLLEEVNNDSLDAIVDFVAHNERMLLYLYNNQLPDDFFRTPLVLESILFKMSDLQAKVEDQIVNIQDARVAAVLEKFIEQVLSNPLVFLTFRGYGAEQFLHDVREVRSQSVLKKLNEKSASSKLREFQQFKASYEEFYLGNISEPLNLSVRADELPAALLKRLDHLPTQGGVEYIDLNLETAYERITRLAQSLGRFI